MAQKDDGRRRARCRIERTLVLCALCMLSGCVDLLAQSYLKLSERASFDLQCPATQLTMAPIGEDDDMVRVKGCGVQAIYVESAGRWLLDSPLSRRAAPSDAALAGDAARVHP